MNFKNTSNNTSSQGPSFLDRIQQGIKASSPPATLSSYYQRLEKGEFLNDILKNASAEEEQFLVERINLLKSYEEGLAKTKLVEVIDDIKNKTTLSQIINELDSLSLVRILGQLPQLQIIEKELGPSVGSKNIEILGTNNSNQGPYGQKREQVLHNDRTQQSPVTKSPSSSSQIKYYNHPDADVVVDFGKTVQGKTFKELLQEKDKHFTWFQWLKYHHTESKSKECANKAYVYFAKYLDYWDQIELYTSK